MGKGGKVMDKKEVKNGKIMYLISLVMVTALATALSFMEIKGIVYWCIMIFVAPICAAVGHYIASDITKSR